MRLGDGDAAARSESDGRIEDAGFNAVYAHAGRHAPLRQVRVAAGDAGTVVRAIGFGTCPRSRPVPGKKHASRRARTATLAAPAGVPRKSKVAHRRALVRQNLQEENEAASQGLSASEQRPGDSAAPGETLPKAARLTPALPVPNPNRGL